MHFRSLYSGEPSIHPFVYKQINDDNIIFSNNIEWLPTPKPLS